MAGAGTNAPLTKAAAELKKYQKASTNQLPSQKLAKFNLINSFLKKALCNFYTVPFVIL